MTGNARDMIDNAATASQNWELMDDPVTREAIMDNVIAPLMLEIESLRREREDLRMFCKGVARNITEMLK